MSKIKQKISLLFFLAAWAHVSGMESDGAKQKEWRDAALIRQKYLNLAIKENLENREKFSKEHGNSLKAPQVNLVNEVGSNAPATNFYSTDAALSLFLSADPLKGEFAPPKVISFLRGILDPLKDDIGKKITITFKNPFEDDEINNFFTMELKSGESVVLGKADPVIGGAIDTVKSYFIRLFTDGQGNNTSRLHAILTPKYDPQKGTWRLQITPIFEKFGISFWDGKENGLFYQKICQTSNPVPFEINGENDVLKGAPSGPFFYHAQPYAVPIKDSGQYYLSLGFEALLEPDLYEKFKGSFVEITFNNKKNLDPSKHNPFQLKEDNRQAANLLVPYYNDKAFQTFNYEEFRKKNQNAKLPWQSRFQYITGFLPVDSKDLWRYLKEDVAPDLTKNEVDPHSGEYLSIDKLKKIGVLKDPLNDKKTNDFISETKKQVISQWIEKALKPTWLDVLSARLEEYENEEARKQKELEAAQKKNNQGPPEDLGILEI